MASIIRCIALPGKEDVASSVERVVMLRPAIAALLALSSVGCVYTGRDLHLPDAVPAFNRIDVEASELELVDAGADLELDSALAFRARLAEALEQATAGSNGSEPARFRARIHIKDKNHGPYWVPFVSLAALLGATTEGATVHVSLTLETRSGRVVASAEAEDRGSIYASALDRAIVLAVQRALTTSPKVSSR
jgi:hypothetical protein